MDSTKVVEYI